MDRPNRHISSAVLHLTVLFSVSTAISACTASTSAGPDRLYSTGEEAANIKVQFGLPDFRAYAGMSQSDRIRYRNNYIAARMYAIDVEYSQYEASLTQERQSTGFGSTVATVGLTTAATLTGPAAAKNILTALATGVTATRASYSDEVLAKQTVPIIMTQMRANRSRIAAAILGKMSKDDGEYPLALALSDEEEYYQAGTITDGLVAVGISVSNDAAVAAEEKSAVQIVTLSHSATTSIITKYLHPNGVYSTENAKILQAVLDKIYPGRNLHLKIITTAAEYESIRVALIKEARL